MAIAAALFVKQVVRGLNAFKENRRIFNGKKSKCSRRFGWKQDCGDS